MTRKLKLHSLFLVLFLLVPANTPAMASSQEICENGICTVTFQYSGSSVSWIPPQGAKSLSFEIYGAQGGQSGGQGGRVTGRFTHVPELLIVTVGGAGGNGAGAPGGFNGGGQAGISHGTEGSGGGATDLRTGPLLSERVVVAGGGGGRGASSSSGARGGHGGGLTGASGEHGQGEGGSGGSQTAGGSGGSRNGTGSAGSAGTLGNGGAGGNSSLFGGGGGGGGYYGGGGGGSDTQSCCADAGGGGGGSSYANTSLVTNISNTQGVRLNNGLAILRYEIAPKIEFFAPSTIRTKDSAATFYLDFNMGVTGLSISDFTTSGVNCEIRSISGSLASYEILVDSCGEGVFYLAVSANSVQSGLELGPQEKSFSSALIIDQTAPEIVSFEKHEISDLIQISFSEEVEEMTGPAYRLISEEPGCVIDSKNWVSTSDVEIQLAGCEEADFHFEVLAHSHFDLAGNEGPSQDYYLEISNKVLVEPEPEQIETQPEPEPESDPDSGSESSEAGEAIEDGTNDSDSTANPEEAEVDNEQAPETNGSGNTYFEPSPTFPNLERAPLLIAPAFGLELEILTEEKIGGDLIKPPTEEPTDSEAIEPILDALDRSLESAAQKIWIAEPSESTALGLVVGGLVVVGLLALGAGIILRRRLPIFIS
jgi:hypothetical protein